MHQTAPPRSGHANSAYRHNTHHTTAQRKSLSLHIQHPTGELAPPHQTTHNTSTKSQATCATPTCERRLWSMAALSSFPMPAPPLTSSTVCLPSPRVARTRLEVVLAIAPVPPGRCHAFLRQQRVRRGHHQTWKMTNCRLKLFHISGLARLQHATVEGGVMNCSHLRQTIQIIITLMV